MMTIILTGGASRRMGRDKALLDIKGRALVELLAERYSQLGEVALSVAGASSFQDIGYKILPDQYPGLGPINGIISAFRQTQAERIFLTAVDLPFGDVELARLLLDRLENYDACLIQRNNGLDEPAFAVYSRSSLEKAENCLMNGRRSFKNLLATLNVRKVREEDLPQFDLSRILFNMNTPDDYKSVVEVD